MLAAMLPGCGYFGCKDDLKREYVPEPTKSRWQDSRTLEVQFGGALRSPSEVDPGRFALLRYNVEIAPSSDYYCHFDLCYRELDQVAAIPESLGWDPSEPEVLRLHFAEPIPASLCEPWPGNRADFQALELIYLGVEGDSYSETGEVFAEPDELAYADDLPVYALGPDQALHWLEDCYVGGPCELDEFCVDRGGYGDWSFGTPSNLWVDCP